MYHGYVAGQLFINYMCVTSSHWLENFDAFFVGRVLCFVTHFYSSFSYHLFVNVFWPPVESSFCLWWCQFGGETRWYQAELLG